MNSNTKNLITTNVGVILIAGVLTVPLAFDHQLADARNVKVKSVKNTIKNKIKAITRAAGTGNDGISSDGSTGTGTNGNPGSSTNGVPGTEEAEASLLLSLELTVLVIRQELVVLAELRALDVLAPAVTVELVAQVDLILAYRALFLAGLRVNRL